MEFFKTHFKYLPFFLFGLLLCHSTDSKGQVYNYQLSEAANAVLRLLATDVTGVQLVETMEKLKNQKWSQLYLKTKNRLDGVSEDDKLELALNMQLGRISSKSYGLGNSYQYFTRALFLAEKLEDQKSIAIASYEIGNIIRLGTINDRPFEDYFQKAIDIFDALDDPLGKSYMLYAKMILEKDSAIKLRYAEEAITLLERNLESTDTLMMESLAKHYNVAGSYQTEELKVQRFQEGLRIAKAIGIEINAAYILNNVGFYYASKQAYDQAIPYHLEALDLAVLAGGNGLAANALNNLSICYSGKGLHKEALDFYKGVFYIQSDLNSNTYFKNIAELEVTHEVDRIELQNQLLQSEHKLQNRQKWVFVTLSLLLLLIIGFVFWSRRRVAKANEKLLALDKVKTRFFANISHELRTPLTLINAPIESLMHNEKINDPEVLEVLETATRNGESLRSLIEEILDLAKLDGGKLELVENPVRLNNFLELLLSDYSVGFSNKSIRFQYDFRLNPDLAILMDEKRCTKVINNLLSNALKFTPEGGEIKVNVDKDKSGDFVNISVSDTGVGIHPEDLPHIFNRYFQSGQPGKKAEGGTGIGLALAKELAELHNGSLRVESQLAKGTEFIFSLPFKEVKEETVTSLFAIEDQNLRDALQKTVIRYKEQFKVEKPTLLVTEDHSEMRAFIAKTLTPYFEIHQAENGKVALDILKQQQIDIVISDVMMPIMDGFELLEEIKKDEALHQVSLIMLTARADHEDKLYALTLGIDDYLTKPFNASEFLARIKNILENRIKIFRSLAMNKQSDINDFIAQYDLVEREVEVLSLLSRRYSNPQIAEELSISRNTVKFHLKNIFLKLEISSRAEAEDMVKSYLK
ncbi:hybrid sensor histidine kinase/response regulator [Roseivirga misakiensis]|uniref:histidine kinase n=1 Tax=Roseivirga misakiensis TaxID=1563681 RepID=A0A1E5SY35_9BACT|nr:ATP-binding protein [Roseivirga misakiensis]OEK04026.1 hypothetical protein BFP71_11050 [Roseivirga misakiensis]